MFAITYNIFQFECVHYVHLYISFSLLKSNSVLYKFFVLKIFVYFLHANAGLLSCEAIVAGTRACLCMGLLDNDDYVDVLILRFPRTSLVVSVTTA